MADDLQIDSMVTISGAEYVYLTSEVERLRAREKDITLEGLSLIGRLEAIREALAETDAGSLPNDYPVQKMAQDRMAELASLRATNERLRAALEEVMPFVEFQLHKMMEERNTIPITRALGLARAALGGEK
jgi:hypothetical protein